MVTKYELETPNNIQYLTWNWTDPEEIKEISLETLGRVKLGYRTYVIINTQTQRVKLTQSYRAWLKELAVLYSMHPDRTDIAAFRTMRGFRPRFRSAMYIS